ncbi:hypothetical protein [Pseudoalteromonas sp. JC28]|nr:hypothetical protein [Pseudoalteromonas sp. JC28]
MMEFLLEWWKQMLAAGVVIVGAGSIAWLRATFVSRAKRATSQTL